MSTSAQQLAANQANAQLSTGPRTAAGKAASSRNSLSHGLSSGFAVLPCEDQSDYDDLLLNLRVELQPESEHEVFLVEQMAQARWRLARIQALEAEALAALLDPPADRAALSHYGRIAAGLAQNGGNALALLLRYASAAERSYYKAHRELQRSRHEAAHREELERHKRLVQEAFNRPRPLPNGFAWQDSVQDTAPAPGYAPPAAAASFSAPAAPSALAASLGNLALRL